MNTELPSNRPNLPNELKLRVLAAVAREPAAARRSVTRARVLSITLSWLFALGVFIVVGGPRLTDRPLALALGTAAGSGFVAAIALFTLLGREQSTLGRPPALLLSVAGLGPVAVLAWKIGWSAQFDGAFAEWPARPGFRCLALGLIIGVAPLLAFCGSRRSSDPRSPSLTGLAAGLAIGSATLFLTDLWCPVGNIRHLMLGHILPVALLGAVGWFLGFWMLGIKPRRLGRNGCPAGSWLNRLVSRRRGHTSRVLGVCCGTQSHRAAEQ